MGSFQILLRPKYSRLTLQARLNPSYGYHTSFDATLATECGVSHCMTSLPPHLAHSRYRICTTKNTQELPTSLRDTSYPSQRPSFNSLSPFRTRKHIFVYPQATIFATDPTSSTPRSSSCFRCSLCSIDLNLSNSFRGRLRRVGTHDTVIVPVCFGQ